MKEENKADQLSGYTIVDTVALKVLVDHAAMSDVGNVLIKFMEDKQPRHMTVEELEAFNKFVESKGKRRRRKSTPKDKPDVAEETKEEQNDSSDV